MCTVIASISKSCVRVVAMLKNIAKLSAVLPCACALNQVALMNVRESHDFHEDVAIALLQTSFSKNVNKPSGQTRFCKKGKLVPEFYVLGVQNSATTSFSTDLLKTLQVLPAPGNTPKEWNYFYSLNASDEDRWSNSLIACPPSGRLVMTDFSVANIYTIPLPSDLQWSSSFGFPNHMHLGFKPMETDCEAWNTPKFIHQFSGHLSGNLKMMIMLREPLARIHSEYYHSKQYSWIEKLTKIPFQKCFGCSANHTFVESFRHNVNLLQQTPPQLSDWFWKSFYARQVEEFLKYFDAAQFMFVPMRIYTASQTADFSQDLLQRLDINATGWKAASHLNDHVNKPALDSEMPPTHETRKAYQALMKSENDRLVSVISKAQLGGAWLPEFSGTQGDQKDVWSWLESNW